MFEQRLPPEYEVAIYRVYENQLLNRCELHRLAATETARRPSIADQLLLVTGNMLIALGERIRAQSIAAGLATG
jgi:hypothetical protein